jgi:UDP-N-acetylmuramoylalanine--D-glutamate ligase
MTAGEPEGYAGRKVLVAGVGVAGVASARALLAAGAEVTVVDHVEGPQLAELATAGAGTVVAPGWEPATVGRLCAGVSDVVVSPGFAPDHPLASAAVAAGLDVYSEPELAWRLRGEGSPPWLAVTGTNGKTTTVTMLAAILGAGGLRTAALGNIGVPLVPATTIDAARYDVLAVELSSFQLHWSRRLAPESAAVLNLAADHLSWHGDLAAYAEAKTRAWRSAGTGRGVSAGNLDDPWVAASLARLPGRVVGWTLGAPAPGQLGVVDGMLVDAAFSETGELAPAPGHLVELVEADVIRPVGDHNVSNALAAATLARAGGVPAAAIRAGLTGYVPEPHRNALVATVDGVTYVDDSKATNPHAALASLMAYPRIVWVAGGQLKGVDVTELVAAVADRLAGVVLLGVDRALIATALARHAPDIPVVDVASTDDGAMAAAVAAAVGLARPGDTVLLAPAAASLDMFVSYARRGAAFAEAVERTAGVAGRAAGVAGRAAVGRSG